MHDDHEVIRLHRPTVEAKGPTGTDELKQLDDHQATRVDESARGNLVLERLPPGIQARLSFLEGPERGRAVVLDRAHNRIGRSQECDVVLSCPSISGKHAAIYFLDSLEWRIEDLGSRNGTLLNGSRVKGFALRSGDKIFIGDTLMQFTVERT